MTDNNREHTAPSRSLLGRWTIRGALAAAAVGALGAAPAITNHGPAAVTTAATVATPGATRHVMGKPGVQHAAAATAGRTAASLPTTSTVSPNCPGCVPPLTSHGGPVQHHPKLYVVMWGPKWNTDTSGTAAAVVSFARTVGGTQWNGVLGQYYDKSGPVFNDATFGGSWTDPTGPSGPIDQGGSSYANLGSSEALHAAAVNHWTLTADSQVIVLPQSGTINAPGAYCAYHDYIQGVSYSIIPYLSDLAFDGCAQYYGGPNYTGTLVDGMTVVTSHEYAETVTDPQLNGWYMGAHNENGDFCAYGGMQVFGTVKVEQTWDNGMRECTYAAMGSHGALTQWGLNRMDAFVRGTNNLLYHRIWNGTVWSGWNIMSSPPGGLTSEPSAVAWGNNRIDVVVRGTDNGMWHMAWNGLTWTPWENLGGIVIGAPAISSSAPGRLDVFTNSADGHIWQKSLANNAWGGYVPISAPAAGIGSDPTAISITPYRTDLFIRGADAQLYHSVRGATGWGTWQSLGGTLLSAPSVASVASNNLDVFYTGVDNQLYHTYAANATTFSPHYGLGGNINSAPAAVGHTIGHVDVIARQNPGGQPLDIAYNNGWKAPQVTGGLMW